MLLEISQNSQESTCARASFLMKMQASGLQLYSKRDSDTGVFLWILWNFLEHLFHRTPLGNSFYNLIWQDAISQYLLLRFNQGNWLLFGKLKGNYSLKRKKQPVRVIRENSCMLKEAATTRCSRSQMLFKVGVLKNFAIFTGKYPCWSRF